MNWKAMAVAFAGATGLLLLLIFGLSHDPRAVPTPMIGNAAPDFSLPTLQGDTLTLAQAGDRPLVINFWASWCLPCQDEHPLLVDYEARHRGQVRMIGVVYQDTRANALRWIHERGGNWTNLLDDRSRMAIEYGVRGVPETFFITRDRRVLYHHPLPVTGPVLEFWTDSLLALDHPPRGPGS